MTDIPTAYPVPDNTGRVPIGGILYTCRKGTRVVAIDFARTLPISIGVPVTGIMLGASDDNTHQEGDEDDD